VLLHSEENNSNLKYSSSSRLKMAINHIQYSYDI
jgi:hypothetical protein